MSANDIGYMFGNIWVYALIGGLIGLVVGAINKKRNPYATENKKVVGTVVAVSLLGIVGAVLFNVFVLAEKEETFTKAGLTITLTDKFGEKDMAAYTAYYESRQAVVFTLKEEFSLFEQAGISSEMSLDEYVKVVSDANNKSYIAKEKDGLTYFEFNQTINGKDFSYFAVVYRGDDAYWLVQFACENKNYSEFSEKFVEWAKTVVV